MLRFIKDTFVEEGSTIGVAFGLKDVRARDGRPFRLHLWDFSGQPRFKTLLGPMCIGASGGILVYNAASASIEMFRSLESWIDIIRSNALTINTNGVAIPVPIALVGTKIDMLAPHEQRDLDNKQVRVFMNKHSIALHHLVSSKTGQGVATIFEQFASHIGSMLAGTGGDGNE